MRKSELIIHNIQQGSKEWLSLRGKFHTASNANAVMCDSQHSSYKALLDGFEQSVSPALQAVFDKGHAVEAAAREILNDSYADELIEIRPLCASRGNLWCSADGIAFDVLTGDMLNWGIEHKQWNNELAQIVSRGQVPPSHKWQLVQMQYVFGLNYIFFIVSDGTTDKWVNCKFIATDDEIQQLLARWNQFEIDKANYIPDVPVNATEKTEYDFSFPVPQLQVTGELLTKEHHIIVQQQAKLAKESLTGLLIRNSADFEGNQELIKKLKKAESELKEYAENAYKQVTDIGEAVAGYKKAAAIVAEVRLERENAGKNFSENFETDEINGCIAEITEYKKSFPSVVFQPIADSKKDFELVIKGMQKRNFDGKKAKLKGYLVGLKAEVDIQLSNHAANTAKLADYEQYRVSWERDYKSILTLPPAQFIAEMDSRVQAAIHAETARKNAIIDKKINEIAYYANSMKYKSDDGLKADLAAFQSFDYREYGQRAPDAMTVVTAAISNIQFELGKRELDRQAKIEAEKKAEQARIEAAARKAEQDAIAKAKLESERLEREAKARLEAEQVIQSVNDLFDAQFAETKQIDAVLDAEQAIYNQNQINKAEELENVGSDLFAEEQLKNIVVTDLNPRQWQLVSNAVAFYCDRSQAYDSDWETILTFLESKTGVR